MLDLACGGPLLSVTYAMNMFGNAGASCMVSFDAPNVFEATEKLTDRHGDCDDFNDKATDTTAKNEIANFSRTETGVCAALGTHGTRRGNARPDPSSASLGHPADGSESEER